jgi:preprotein translocase subunit SecA
MGFLDKITNLLGNSDEKAVSKIQPLVDEINSFEDDMESLTDLQLAEKTKEFKVRILEGEHLDSLLPEAFAVVREAAKRTLGQRHYDVQLIGGITLHQGKIAEMRTGEGKTLVATLAAYLNSLNGEGVHVVTVNDYLAKRDAEWMGSVYAKLGISVGALQNNGALLLTQSETGWTLTDCERSEAYKAEITYGTNNEFGFDFLRDNMADTLNEMVQSSRSFAIVDEVDNILIDEARTPLIISGPSQQNPTEYAKFAKLVPALKEEEDFTIDEKLRAVSLTVPGIEKIEKTLRVDNLYDVANFGLVHFIENALRADVLYQKDKEYVVRNGEVIIVDEFTGRLMEGRRYSDGLHQAIEAKENVTIQRESVTYATITLQNFFRLYGKLSGMTGTAATEAEEFWKIYKLEVVAIPTNKPVKRIDNQDLIYRDQKTKYAAVVEEIEERIHNGQPVLVGTTDIDRSEIISKLLKTKGIKHEVLNAKQHEREAVIVSQAGRPGSVTVATNMAGRGTDIVLGGIQEPGEEIEAWQQRHAQVIEAGGLCIIGTERHEARRIDNQLRGRSGRQGDPGETRFFVSLDDDLVRRFGGDRIQSIMDWAGMDDQTPIENGMISKSIENAQVKVEAFHFDMRKHLVDYDDVVNTHRDVIYQQREKVISGVDLSSQIKEMIISECESIIFNCMPGNIPENWDMDRLLVELSNLIPLNEELGDRELILDQGPSNYLDSIIAHLNNVYGNFEGTLGSEMCRRIEGFLMLRSIDLNWVQHLTSMENLRQGIGLQAVGQRDPLVMYRKEGHEMFQTLQQRIQEDVSHTILRTGTESIQQPVKSRRAPLGRRQPSSEMAKVGARQVQSKRTSSKVGRNEPCPCGSGKKYKRCCGLAA